MTGHPSQPPSPATCGCCTSLLYFPIFTCFNYSKHKQLKWVRVAGLSLRDATVRNSGEIGSDILSRFHRPFIIYIKIVQYITSTLSVDPWLSDSFDGLVFNTFFTWRSLLVLQSDYYSSLLNLFSSVASSPLFPLTTSLCVSLHVLVSPLVLHVIMDHTAQCFATAFKGACVHMLLNT